MTACTICAAPTPGDADANEAWCAWCFALNICAPQDPAARRLAAEVQARVAGWRRGPLADGARTHVQAPRGLEETRCN